MTDQQQIDPNRVQEILSAHLSAYSVRRPHYQVVMLESLLEVWLGHHARLLDVGGGTGVMAQAMKELFLVDLVVAIDLVDRFCEYSYY